LGLSGTFRYRFAQLVDQKKGTTFRPLVQSLSASPHDQYLDEALEPLIGLVVHVSFRRATKELERIQGQPMSHTTVHGRLQQFAQEHDPFGHLKAIPF
jgi:hypothetical protein